MRVQLVRDKFIAGQRQCVLHRHLDSAGPDTPISSFVDKCRVWESHEEQSNYPDVGNLANRLREMVQQPGMEGSGSIDIRHLLRQLLPIDTEIGGAGQLTSEAKRW